MAEPQWPYQAAGAVPPAANPPMHVQPQEALVVTSGSPWGRVAQRCRESGLCSVTWQGPEAELEAQWTRDRGLPPAAGGQSASWTTAQVRAESRGPDVVREREYLPGWADAASS